MRTRYFWFLVVMLALSLVGCTNLPPLGTSSQAGTPELTVAPNTTLFPTSAAQASLTPTVAGTPSITAQPAGSALRIWLPPEFDPQGKSLASRLLQDRLDEFTAKNPEVKLEIRIKAVEGEGGLIDSLVAANVSAPLALPDLILIPRPVLESAVIKGLLIPFDGLTHVMEERGWFSYAEQLARLKTSTYGLPFAGDAMLLAYRPTLMENPPRNLDSFIQLGEELLFPASDPQSLFTLSIYVESGGSLQDVQGRPTLDKSLLTSVFSFYQRASQAGVMPYSLTQYSDNDQVWEAFLGGEFPFAVTWASTFLKNSSATPDELAIASLPSWDGAPFTFATGWDFALAGKDQARRVLSVRLAEFLIEKEFMAAWTSAAGYLPTRVEALQKWQESDIRQRVEQISYSAHLMPPADVISSLGPALEQAAVEVLKAERDPKDAAQFVIDQVNQP